MFSVIFSNEIFDIIVILNHNHFADDGDIIPWHLNQPTQYLRRWTNIYLSQRSGNVSSVLGTG